MYIFEPTELWEGGRQALRTHIVYVSWLILILVSPQGQLHTYMSMEAVLLQT